LPTPAPSSLGSISPSFQTVHLHPSSDLLISPVLCSCAFVSFFSLCVVILVVFGMGRKMNLCLSGRLKNVHSVGFTDPACLGSLDFVSFGD
jgi:hypothetical protein